MQPAEQRLPGPEGDRILSCDRLRVRVAEGTSPLWGLPTRLSAATGKTPDSGAVGAPRRNGFHTRA